jgi:flagellar biosynthesis protein FlhF
VLQELMTLAQAELAAGCERHVLALSGQVSLNASESGDAYECQVALLLSDRSGQPLAAPNQWLSTAAARKPGLRVVQWLQQQAVGKALVHLLPRLPGADFFAQVQGEPGPAGLKDVQWLARAPGSTVVIDPRTGALSTLAQLEFEFDAPRPASFRGKPALQCEAHALVLLRTGAATAEGAPALRCVVTRLLDARSRKVLSQGYVLSNVGMDVGARQIAQWQAWAAEAEPCFRLLRQGLQLAGGMGEPGDPQMLKRLLVAGQVTTTVWRLQSATGEWADRTRALLGQLTGRAVRPDRPLSGSVLYAGVDKLFALLEALGTDTATPSATQPRVAAQHG